MTSISTTTTRADERPVRRARPTVWTLAAGALLAIGVGAAAYFGGVTTARVKHGLEQLTGAVSPKPHNIAAPAAPAARRDQWDGLVRVTSTEEAAAGFKFAPVVAQKTPIMLELTGRTAYDTNTVKKVRPRFDARVETVFVSLGQKIKKGDPLVEIYSNDLAAAKTDFQTKYVQWRHDVNVYNLRQKLIETEAIAKQLWVDTVNQEQKSRFDFNIALDKLTLYDVPKEEIDPLLEGLSDKQIDPRNFGSIPNKAKMTLRSKADGFVISYDVVPGNFYESTDVLLEVAPLDHLWVWVNVYELDQDKVAKHQVMEIQFPYLSQKIAGKVDYVANEVSKDTRAVKVRASIPNPDGKLKADMLVKALLEIQPQPGQTSIPRLAMVALSGGEYVFVRNAKSSPDEKPGIDVFERRKVEVARENTDFVVVTRGLLPGEEVVTNGSLILSQLFEDERIVVSGLNAE